MRDYTNGRRFKAKRNPLRNKISFEVADFEALLFTFFAGAARALRVRRIPCSQWWIYRYGDGGIFVTWRGFPLVTFNRYFAIGRSTKGGFVYIAFFQLTCKELHIDVAVISFHTIPARFWKIQVLQHEYTYSPEWVPVAPREPNWQEGNFNLEGIEPTSFEQFFRQYRSGYGPFRAWNNRP